MPEWLKRFKMNDVPAIWRGLQWVVVAVFAMLGIGMIFCRTLKALTNSCYLRVASDYAVWSLTLFASVAILGITVIAYALIRSISHDRWS